MVNFSKLGPRRAGDFARQNQTSSRSHKPILPRANDFARRGERNGAEDLEISLALLPQTASSEASAPPVFPDANASPESNHSTGLASFEGSIVPTSWSGSTRLLSRKRKLTSVPETPTSSDISVCDVGGPSLSRVGGLAGGKRRGSLSQCSENADYRQQLSSSSMDETLMHVGLQNAHLSPRALDVMQEERFVSIGRTHEAKAQPTETTSPWNGHTLREDAGMPNRSTQKGGRRHGLTVEQAKHASEMRKLRVCLKCHMNRDKCSGETPCGKCNTKERSWKLGCTKLRLEDCIEYFVPDFLFHYLYYKKVYEFMNTNASVWKGEPFHLALTQKLGGLKEKLLYIRAREVEPLSDKLLRKRMHLAVDGQNVESIHLTGVPIYACYQNDGAKCEEIIVCIHGWLRDIEETESHDWHWYCFLDETDELWERDIMGEICKYYHENGDRHSELKFTQLKNALRLTVLLYITMHSFAVPQAKAGSTSETFSEHYIGANRVVACVADLYKRLELPYFEEEMSGKEVSPRAVNMFIAMLLLPTLTVTAHKALKDLGDLLSSRNSDRTTRELVFCTAYCCLMAVAHFQTLILLDAIEDPVVSEQAISLEEAKTRIMRMENELGRFAIELSVVKLRKTRDKVRPVEQGSLFERLRRITERYSKLPSLRLMQDNDNEQMRGSTTRRITNLRPSTRTWSRRTWADCCASFTRLSNNTSNRWRKSDDGQLGIVKVKDKGLLTRQGMSGSELQLAWEDCRGTSRAADCEFQLANT